MLLNKGMLNLIARLAFRSALPGEDANNQKSKDLSMDKSWFAIENIQKQDLFRYALMKRFKHIFFPETMKKGIETEEHAM